MGHHTFDVEKAEKLEHPNRYRYLSRDELLSLLATDSTSVVADLGSGTGFYTDDVAARAGTVYAVDVQEEMHDVYREKGLPENVEAVTANVSDLPLDDDSLDAAFSTMTYHEFASEETIAELGRVLRPGGRVVVVDWSATGDGEAGPPTDHRYHVGDAATRFLEGGFEVDRASSRLETFVLVASNR